MKISYLSCLTLFVAMSLWNISCSRPGPSAQKLFGHDQWQGLNLGENVSLLQTLDPRTELGTGANMQDPGNTALPPPPNYPLPVLDPFTGGPLLPVPPPPPPPPALLPPLPPAAIGPRCGNQIFLAGKECEDGNQINGDGCSSNCVKEYCGNGLVELYEDCDNGAGRFTVQGPNCDQYCQFIICGDKYVTGDEECDDGNLINCDGCSSCCKVENQCGSAECPCPPTK